MPSTPTTGSADTMPVGDARDLRADARRNISAILDAALACLARDPDVSMGEIAKAAGVGRATLYGHFPSRAELVDAVFAHAVERAEQALSAVDTTGDPRHALADLIASSWRLVTEFRALLAAAERELPAERIRAHHDQPLHRVQALIARGQREGVFRGDQPTSWLVTVFYSMLHSAADEITAGRLPDHDAIAMITATLLSAYAPPAPSTTATASTSIR
ncbi:TetR/AcrR family transcriptional regulator [Nonomuraea sp. 10N515B]|uniref:TetR/AcrR family transcriptional regulator n=1 Tax=Nonomuraea sp. 10N515B TaxID=3457422 RepID=UPI003FCD53EF